MISWEDEIAERLVYDSRLTLESLINWKKYGYRDKFFESSRILSGGGLSPRNRWRPRKHFFAISNFYKCHSYRDEPLSPANIGRCAFLVDASHKGPSMLPTLLICLVKLDIHHVRRRRQFAYSELISILSAPREPLCHPLISSVFCNDVQYLHGYSTMSRANLIIVCDLHSTSFNEHLHTLCT